MGLIYCTFTAYGMFRKSKCLACFFVTPFFIIFLYPSSVVGDQKYMSPVSASFTTTLAFSRLPFGFLRRCFYHSFYTPVILLPTHAYALLVCLYT